MILLVHSTDNRKAELVKCQHGRKKVTDTKSLSIKISVSDCTYRHSKIRLTLLWILNVFHQLFGYARAKFGQLMKMQSHFARCSSITANFSTWLDFIRWPHCQAGTHELAEPICEIRTRVLPILSECTISLWHSSAVLRKNASGWVISPYKDFLFCNK